MSSLSCARGGLPTHDLQHQRIRTPPKYPLCHISSILEAFFYLDRLYNFYIRRCRPHSDAMRSRTLYCVDAYSSGSKALSIVILTLICRSPSRRGLHHDLSLLLDEIIPDRVYRVENRFEIRPAVRFRVPTGFHQRINRRWRIVGAGKDVAFLHVAVNGNIVSVT